MILRSQLDTFHHQGNTAVVGRSVTPVRTSSYQGQQGGVNQFVHGNLKNKNRGSKFNGCGQLILCIMYIVSWPVRGGVGLFRGAG